jgi:hypothetical protein
VNLIGNSINSINSLLFCAYELGKTSVDEFYYKQFGIEILWYMLALQIVLSYTKKSTPSEKHQVQFQITMNMNTRQKKTNKQICAHSIVF